MQTKYANQREQQLAKVYHCHVKHYLNKYTIKAYFCIWVAGCYCSLDKYLGIEKTIVQLYN